MAVKKTKGTSTLPKAGAAERTHSEDGVDLTLIRQMLTLTPAERLEVLQNSARAVLARGPLPRGWRQREQLGQESIRRALGEKLRK